MTIRKFFYALNDLQDIILTSYLERHYKQKIQSYEFQIYKKRQTLFKELEKIRQTFKNHDDNKFLFASLEKLYELLFSMDCLKFRVKDRATFEVCEKNFKEISSALRTTLLTNNDDQKLSEAIDNFEALYQHTLQTVSNDPVVFLFFLNDLKTWNETYTELKRWLTSNAL